MTLVAVLTVATVSAQGLTFGPRIGMNLSKITNFESDAKVGFTGGLFVTGYFTNKLGVDVSAMLSKESSTRTIDDGTYSEMTTKSLNINVPIVLKYKVFSIFNIFAGPQFIVPLSVKNDVGDFSFNSKDYFKSAAVTGVVGAGVELGSININLNYVIPSNITKDVTIDDFSDNLAGVLSGMSIADRIKTGVWQITVGFGF